MEGINNEINVRYFPQLNGINIEEVGDFLELKTAKYSIACRNWAKEYPYHPVTVFTVGRSDSAIFIDYFVRGNYLRAVNYKNNSPVSEDSCVEFFMKLPESNEYWNFEFNCIGTVNASHRVKRSEPTRLSDEEIATIMRYASCGTRPFEEMEGVFAWNLTVAIPFKLVGIDASNLPKYILGNFYKCGAKMSLPHYLSWAPIDTPAPDFHRPEYFGRINFI